VSRTPSRALMRTLTVLAVIATCIALATTLGGQR
jgi:hypothetical protein